MTNYGIVVNGINISTKGCIISEYVLSAGVHTLHNTNNEHLIVISLGGVIRFISQTRNRLDINIISGSIKVYKVVV